MAYKTKDAIKRELRKHWETACNYYLVELFNMWGLSAPNGFWVADDIGGTFCYGEIYINMEDIKFCVENDVTLEEYTEWMDYCVWAHEFKQSSPNLRSWHNGCPRVDKSTQEKLSTLKLNMEKLMEETRQKVLNYGAP